MFPGLDITRSQPQLIGTIQAACNPRGLPPSDVLDQATSVGTEVFGSRFFSETDEFYLLYEPPDHERLKRLFAINKGDLLSFLEAKINPDRMEGIDVSVATQDLRKFLVCNHDGEMYLIVET